MHNNCTQVFHGLFLSVRLTTVFLPEEISPSQPFSGPGHCVVTDLIVMAMADGVFKNVGDFDQLGRLMNAVQPDQTIRLQMKETSLKIPILRAYTDGTHFIISQTKALKYAALYKQYESLGKGAGFEGISNFSFSPLSC
jgi:hypothetical protein